MNFYLFLFCICFGELLNFDKVQTSQSRKADKSHSLVKSLLRPKTKNKDASARLSSAGITSFIDAFENRKSVGKQAERKRIKRSPHFESPAGGIDYMDIDGIGEDLDIGEKQQMTPNNAPGLNGEPALPRPNIASLQTQARQRSEQSAPNTSLTPHETPQYMLDLYARFQNDPFSQPASNIVRSFLNEATSADQLSYEHAYTTCITQRHFNDCPRVHHLTFDVTSVPEHEHVTMAELRLFKIVDRDRRRYIGLDRKVEVVELIRPTGVEANDSVSPVKRSLLDSRRIYGRTSGWETFFITQAIRRWVKSATSSTHELEIYIENIPGSVKETTVDFEETSQSINAPLLVVFSDDASKRHKLEHLEELQELLRHGMSANLPSEDFSADSSLAPTTLEQDTESSVLNRKKRSAFTMCHLERMYVNFGDIGYNTWIVSPEGYPAGRCVGSCDFPFRRFTPHGIIQYLMHRRHKKQVGKPCCVPTKLGPISLLYYEKNSLTYKYNYEGLQVLECGCR